jgi:hypothetical protein
VRVILAARAFSSAVASSFETPACGGLLRMRSETLMVRSAATPRVSNHVAVGCAAITPYLWVHPDEER